MKLNEKRKIKIGILIDRLNVGGVEKIAIEQVRALRLLGAEASLVVLRKKAVVVNAFPDLTKKIPIIYLDQRLPAFFRLSFQFPVFHFFSFFHITYPFLIPFVVKKKEFDYLIVHSTYTAFSAITIKKMRMIPFSAFIWDPIDYILNKVYEHNFLKPVYFLLHTIARFLDRQIIINSDSLLVGGDAHNVYFKKLVPDKKIVTLPPSVHPLPTIPKKKKKYVLLVTAWKEGKKPEYIFELLKYAPYLSIVIAGKWLDENYLENFLRQISEKKYTKQINVTGELSENQLSRYYKEALFVLQINDDRGFGLPALEAAGHGTTFIIPEGQGVCNLFENKMDGFYVKEHDTESIVKYAKRLYDNEKLAGKMGKSAWEKVKKQYSWRKHAQNLVNIATKYE